MDFLRTLKKRRPKRHAKLAEAKAKSRGIRIKKRSTTLNLASCFTIFLVLVVVTPSQAENYYFYKGPEGELVISNKEPPAGSQIIKRVPGTTDKEPPQTQEPDKPQPNAQPDGSPKPSNTK